MSTAVSVGPMHGVQPMPNSTPSSGAPASPALGITDGLKIRPANMNRSNAPKNSSPSRIVTPPSTRVSVESCALNSWPSPPTASPASENTAEKPTTNSAVPATVRPVCRCRGRGRLRPGAGRHAAGRRRRRPPAAGDRRPPSAVSRCRVGRRRRRAPPSRPRPTCR